MAPSISCEREDWCAARAFLAKSFVSELDRGIPAVVIAPLRSDGPWLLMVSRFSRCIFSMWAMRPWFSQ
jgi:hypothetical protein